jgi:hypothetical protein
MTSRRWPAFRLPRAAEIGPQESGGRAKSALLVETQDKRLRGTAVMAVAQRAMTVREWGLLALLSLLWGGSFFFIGVAVKELPPLTLAGLRVGLAALILWASAPLTGAKLPRSGKALAALALLGLGNNALPFGLIAWGQTHLAAGLASILNAATPLFAVLVAHVFTAEEKLSRFKIIGTAAGVAGVAWVIGPDLLWGQANVNAWAEGAVLLAALSYAVSAVFARRVRALGLEPLDVATDRRRRARSISCPSRSSWTSHGRFRSRAWLSSRRYLRSPHFARRWPMSSISAFYPARAQPMCSSSPFWRPRPQWSSALCFYMNGCSGDSCSASR